VPRSIRFPAPVWKQLEVRAKSKGLSLHSALRAACNRPLGVHRRLGSNPFSRSI
jgi:hypothetical protein